MSWYNVSWLYRVPVSVDFSSGAGTKDTSFTVPATYDLFWDNVEDDKADIRITEADGETELTFQVSSWNYATKSCTIQVDDVVSAQACQAQVWLYWGNSTATDPAGSFVPGAAVSAAIERLAPAGDIVLVGLERPGSTRPLHAIAVTSESVRPIYLDFTGLLRAYCTTGAGRQWGEELVEIMAEVRDTDEVIVAGGVDLAAIRYIGCSRGRGGIVMVPVDCTVLSDATNYVLVVAATTSGGATIIARAALYCRDVRPSA